MDGVKVTISMSRELFIDRNKDETDEQFLNRIKKEIVLPSDAINIASNALKRVNLNIINLDLKDWCIDNLDYKLIKNE